MMQPKKKKKGRWKKIFGKVWKTGRDVAIQQGEQRSGIDLDGDGDVGGFGNANKRPKPGRPSNPDAPRVPSEDGKPITVGGSRTSAVGVFVAALAAVIHYYRPELDVNWELVANLVEATIVLVGVGFIAASDGPAVGRKSIAEPVEPEGTGLPAAEELTPEIERIVSVALADHERQREREQARLFDRLNPGPPPSGVRQPDPESGS